jgi:hypothetical protein
MNCKPGDLAVVVRVNQERFKFLLGRFVTVTTSYQNPRTGVACWKYEGEPIVSPTAFVVTGIDDDELRPIRDPGDDAADESRAWLPPVPTLTKVPA